MNYLAQHDQVILQRSWLKTKPVYIFDHVFSESAVNFDQEAAAAYRRVLHRRGAAAGSRARRDEGRRLQRHASLWTDRMLRTFGGERLAPGVGHAAARRTGGKEGAQAAGVVGHGAS